MYVTNGRLELFSIEKPDPKDMVSYLAECPKNVLLTLEYSDFFYKEADRLLMSGLVELHGDKVFMPIYDEFEVMEDDLVEALEAAPLTSINLIPDKLINSRILTLYAKQCLIKGFDKVDISPEMLLYYYHIAADEFNFEDAETFNILWNFDNSDIKMKLMEKFVRLCSYGFHYEDEVISTLVDYFKENYYRLKIKINDDIVYHIAHYEGHYNDAVDEMEYVDIYEKCQDIQYENIRWLLKRLFKNNLLNLFEELVLKVAWQDVDFTSFDNDVKMMKKVKKILRKARRNKK